MVKLRLLIRFFLMCFFFLVRERADADCVVPQVAHSSLFPGDSSSINSGESVTFTCLQPRVHVYGSLRITCSDRENVFDREPPVCGYPEYVLYMYMHISISGGVWAGSMSLTACLKKCKELPSCGAVDFVTSNTGCWLMTDPSSTCGTLRYGLGVLHYQMKRCPGNQDYNCQSCSSGGTCTRTYDRQLNIASQTCVCHLGRTGVRCSEAVTCSNAPAISNTAHTPATGPYVYDSTITYTCNSGSATRDDSSSQFTLTCSHDGTFRGERKSCDRLCQAPTPADHQRQITLPQRRSYFADQTVTYACDTGFKFNNTSSFWNLTCQSDGTFDQVLPKCLPIMCDNPINRAHLAAIPGKAFTYQQNETFACIPGYHFVGHDVNRSLTSQCQADGELEPPLPDCTKRRCSLPVLDNTVTASRNGNLLYMDTVVFSCKNGFVFPDGNVTIFFQCNTSGGFGVDYLNCSEIPVSTVNVAKQIGIGAGIAAAVVLVIVGIIIICVFLRRRRNSKHHGGMDSNRSTNGTGTALGPKPTSDGNFYDQVYNGPASAAAMHGAHVNQGHETKPRDAPSDIHDVYAVPDKTQKSKRTKKHRDIPADYSDGTYENVNNSPKKVPPVPEHEDSSCTYELAGDIYPRNDTDNWDISDEVQFVENDIYQLSGIDNRGQDI